MSSSSSRIRFTSPFEPLQLSESEAETLEKLSRLILHNYMVQYEEYARARANGEGDDGVNERVWKLLKRGEDFAIFKQRKHQRGVDSSLRRTLAGFSNSGAVLPSDLPVILALGVNHGSLDDIMYGIVSPTVESMRSKSAYIDDHIADAAVLYTIVSPSHEDPFQNLVIKWAHIEQSLVLRPAVNNRDFVFMERTGIAFTSTGERLGFHLIHSVHFTQTHELQGSVRGNLSICGIFRDNKELNCVEGYARSIIDPRGNAIHSLVALAAADTLTSADKYIEYAHGKKLMWRLRQRRKASRANCRDREAEKQSTTPDKLGPCTNCRRMPIKLGSVLRDPRKRRCALCAKYVCSSCRIRKTLSQITSPTSKLQQREFAFCDACHDDACRSDALAIAQLELSETATEKEAIETLSAGGNDSQ